MNKAYKGLRPLTSLLPFNRLEQFFTDDIVDTESWLRDEDFDSTGFYNLTDGAWNKVLNLINPKKSPGYPKTLSCRSNAECLTEDSGMRTELETKINAIVTLGISLIDQLNEYDFSSFTDLNEPNQLIAHALQMYHTGTREFVQLTDKGESRELGKNQRLVCAVDLSDNNVERLLFGDWLLKSMDKEMGDVCMAPRLDIMTDEAQRERFEFYEQQSLLSDGLTSTDQPGFEYGVQLQDYMDHMFKALHDHSCLDEERFQDDENDYIIPTNLSYAIIGFYFSNIARVYVTNEGKLFVNTIPGIQVSGRFMTYKLNSDIRAMRSFTVNVYLPSCLAVCRDFMTANHFAHDVRLRFDYAALADAESGGRDRVRVVGPNGIVSYVYDIVSFPSVVEYTMKRWFCETAGDDCIEASAFMYTEDFECAYRWFGWNVTDTVVQKGEYDFCSTKFLKEKSYQTGVWKAAFTRCYKNTEMTDLLNFFLPFKNHPDFCLALARIAVSHPNAVVAFAEDYCGMVGDVDILAIKAFSSFASENSDVPELYAVDWFYQDLYKDLDVRVEPMTPAMRAFLDAYTVAEATACLPPCKKGKW